MTALNNKADNHQPVNIEIADNTPHPALTLLDTVDPDDLTPKQALALLYQLKETKN